MCILYTSRRHSLSSPTRPSELFLSAGLGCFKFGESSLRIATCPPQSLLVSGSKSSLFKLRILGWRHHSEECALVRTSHCATRRAIRRKILFRMIINSVGNRQRIASSPHSSSHSAGSGQRSQLALRGPQIAQRKIVYDFLDMFEIVFDSNAEQRISPLDA